ncbi:hypothetical protein ACNUCX_14725 [Curtobacterium flaccumfaciens pv. flaccumfaciens]
MPAESGLEARGGAAKGLQSGGGRHQSAQRDERGQPGQTGRT